MRVLIVNVEIFLNTRGIGADATGGAFDARPAVVVAQGFVWSASHQIVSIAPTRM